MTPTAVRAQGPLTYRIIRTYRNSGRHRTIRRGLTLEQAQAHCRNLAATRDGTWFDMHEQE